MAVTTYSQIVVMLQDILSNLRVLIPMFSRADEATKSPVVVSQESHNKILNMAKVLMAMVEKAKEDKSIFVSIIVATEKLLRRLIKVLDDIEEKETQIKKQRQEQAAEYFAEQGVDEPENQNANQYLRKQHDYFATLLKQLSAIDKQFGKLIQRLDRLQAQVKLKQALLQPQVQAQADHLNAMVQALLPAMQQPPVANVAGAVAGANVPAVGQNQQPAAVAGAGVGAIVGAVPPQPAAQPVVVFNADNMVDLYENPDHEQMRAAAERVAANDPQAMEQAKQKFVRVINVTESLKRIEAAEQVQQKQQKIDNLSHQQQMMAELALTRALHPIFKKAGLKLGYADIAKMIPQLLNTFVYSYQQYKGFLSAANYSEDLVEVMKLANDVKAAYQNAGGFCSETLEKMQQLDRALTQTETKEQSSKGAYVPVLSKLSTVQVPAYGVTPKVDAPKPEMPVNQKKLTPGGGSI